jgi:hypothetical protein
MDTGIDRSKVQNDDFISFHLSSLLSFGPVVILKQFFSTRWPEDIQQSSHQNRTGLCAPRQRRCPGLRLCLFWAKCASRKPSPVQRKVARHVWAPRGGFNVDRVGRAGSPKGKLSPWPQGGYGGRAGKQWDSH